MKKIFYIAMVFSSIIASDFTLDEMLEDKYLLAQSYRSDKKIDSCLNQLFQIKEDYLKANFDIASIYYQDYKNYDIATYFFDLIIEKYESSNDDKFLIENRDTYKNSVFFSAYIYINDLELYSKGIDRYQNFINKFPNDELADDAMHELKALSKQINQIDLLKNNLK